MKRLLFLFLFCSFQTSFSQLPCAGDSIPINSTGIAVNLISGVPDLSCLISCQCDSSLIIALPPDSGMINFVTLGTFSNVTYQFTIIHNCNPMQVYFDTCVVQQGGAFTNIFWYSGDFTDGNWALYVCGPGSELDWITWKPGGQHPIQNQTIISLADTCQIILEQSEEQQQQPNPFDNQPIEQPRYYDLQGIEIFKPIPKNTLYYDKTKRLFFVL